VINYPAQTMVDESVAFLTGCGTSIRHAILCAAGYVNGGAQMSAITSRAVQGLSMTGEDRTS
jgi:hypothetical protein